MRGTECGIKYMFSDIKSISCTRFLITCAVYFNVLELLEEKTRVVVTREGRVGRGREKRVKEMSCKVMEKTKFWWGAHVAHREI